MSTKTYYDAMMSKLLKHEGGYVNHPQDRGKATNYGITQATYDAWRKRKGLPVQSVIKIDRREEVNTIYREDYANAIRFDELPRGVDYALFDFAVNSGVSRAVKVMQRLVGVRDDGIVGANTLHAIWQVCEGGNYDATSRLIDRLCDARLAYIRSIKTYKTFGRGWERRISEVRQSCKYLCVHGRFERAGGLEPTTAVVVSEAMPKAAGKPSLQSALQHSTRTKAAVVGTVGMAIQAIPEAVSMAQPAQEALGVSWTHWLGVCLTLGALAYIVYRRLHKDALA